MNFIQRFIGHFKTITKHKITVTKLCIQCGLYKQGFLHDLSKYAPVEFFTGIKYFRGNKSPVVAEKEIKGYSMGWLHHKAKNKHHWQYWTDAKIREKEIMVYDMPDKYILEMFCDRIAACKTYEKTKYTDKSALNYYLSDSETFIMGKSNSERLKILLEYLANNGEKETLKYIKKKGIKHGNKII